MKTIALLLLTSVGSLSWSQESADEYDVIVAPHLSPGFVRWKDDLDRKLDESYSKRPPDWSWVTDELRPVVLERLLAVKAEGVREQFYGYSEARLISFGHAETIKDVIGRDFLDPRPPSIQLRYFTDTALPLLMALVMSGSVVDPDGPGIEVSERDRGFSLALGAIENGHFPPATLMWAKRMGGQPVGKGTQERIELLKEWWRQNEEAITANRPMEATWLPAFFRGEPSYASDEELEERRAEVERRREGMKSGREAKEKSPDSSTDGPREHSDKGRLIGWTGGAIGILIALVMFLKKRKSSSRH